MSKNVVIFGASGAIGQSFLEHYSSSLENSIYAFSRSNLNIKSPNVKSFSLDFMDESALQKAVSISTENAMIDVVIVSVGALKVENISPEKSIKDLSYKNLEHIFKVNTFIPALIAKHCAPKLRKDSKSVFAAISARVGSISDNYLGGWYSYRSSKSALNMIIKTASIEIARTNKKAVVVGLHPGTVKSDLSKPFTTNTPEEKLFEPSYSVMKLISVIDNLSFEQTGKCFAWDGKEIYP